MSDTKFKLNKGWTKEKVLKQFKKRNDGTRAVDRDGGCQYRGIKGNCCAVGAFIPDKVYVRVMDSADSTSACTIIPQYSLHQYMPLSVAGMDRMQVFHDNCNYTGNKLYHTNGNTYESIEAFLEHEVE